MHIYNLLVIRVEELYCDRILDFGTFIFMEVIFGHYDSLTTPGIGE